MLSGGDRSRLALCKLLFQPFNVFIMDEPTNHLDMLSKEVLKKALINYEGTLILVSHDRDFLQGLISKVYEFRERKVNEFLGGIQEYLQMRKAKNFRQIEKVTPVFAKFKEQDLTKERYYQKEVKKLKNKINKVEVEIQVLEKSIAESEKNFLCVPPKAEQMSTYDHLRKQLDKKLLLWEAIQKEGEDFLIKGGFPLSIKITFALQNKLIKHLNKMFSSIIVGLQWGDEGKGKITDLLAEKSDYIIRYQGGNNAGHSLHINRESFVLHLIPSGVVHSGKKCLIASGVVVDPRALLEELGMLESRGLDTSGVFLANRAHITLPYHRLLDDYKEELRGARSIGTTRRGIGPTYEDQSARIGIRAIDLLDEKIFYEKLKINLEYKNRIIDCVYGKSPMDFQPIYEEYMGYADKLRPRIIDSVYEIHQALKSGKKLLFEGAQAILLDIAYGTYPYVTTSSPSTGGVCTGAGIPPTALKNFIGVTKAYCTRVGSGPFPTELKDSTAEELRDKGHEYGATTKRPRRCGWLDLVALRYACMINGINHLVMTKLDVLTGFERLRIAIAYEKTDHSRTDQFPASSEALEKMRPVYIDLPGWQENISRVTSYEALPENCKEYLRFIEKFMGIELDIISVGPERRQNIIKKLDLF